MPVTVRPLAVMVVVVIVVIVGMNDQRALGDVYGRSRSRRMCMDRGQAKQHAKHGEGEQ